MVDVANLMANCAEKTYASYYYFHEGFDLRQALTAAKTKEELANVYAYASVQKVGKNLDWLKEIYANAPNSRILDFLLLREINKIEDWVYTPYYTNWLPAIEQMGSYWNDDLESKINTLTLRARSEKDRLYAAEVLNFLHTVDFSNVKNPDIVERGGNSIAVHHKKLFGLHRQNQSVSKAISQRKNHK